jgi:hypothetical protein
MSKWILWDLFINWVGFFFKKKAYKKKKIKKPTKKTK